MVREAVEKTYNRARQLTFGCIFSVVIQITIGFMIFYKLVPISFPRRSPENTLSVFAILVSLSLAGWIVGIVWITIGLVMDALQYSDREEERVEKCVELLNQKYSQPETLQSIESMASHGVTASQLFTVLPVATLTAVATFAAVDNLSPSVGLILAEIVALALLSFALVLGQGNADVVIQKALAELRRRHSHPTSNP